MGFSGSRAGSAAKQQFSAIAPEPEQGGCLHSGADSRQLRYVPPLREWGNSMARAGLLHLRRHRHHRGNHRAQRADAVRKHQFETHAHSLRRQLDKALEAAERIRQRGEDSGSGPSSSIRGRWNDLTAHPGRQRRADAGRVRAVHRRRWSRNWAPSASRGRQGARPWWTSPQYEARINATNYALSHDDGVDLNYDDADVILVGVSRSGKTPTCLYLALHFRRARGELPADRDDLETGASCRSGCAAHRRKLFGLTIDPLRLQQVRQARTPEQSYATLEQCRSEVAAAEALFRRSACRRSAPRIRRSRKSRARC
jgi:hypothetical protein